MMTKLEVRFQVLNILINTQNGHPALQKFVQTGGTGPLNQMCCEIRENKKFTLGENLSKPTNQDLYKRDL